jgi:hypothetical protein
MRTPHLTALATALLASPALASVTKSLIADSYIVTDGTGPGPRVLAVMDVFVQCSSAGDRVTGVFGASGRPNAFRLSNGKTFQHSNATESIDAWKPATHERSWDSYLTIGCRDQSAAVETSLDMPGWSGASNAGQILAEAETSGPGWYPWLGAEGNPYARAGAYNGQSERVNRAKTSAWIAGNGIDPGQCLDNLCMIARFAIDVTGDGATDNTLRLRLAIASADDGASSTAGSPGHIDLYEQTLTFASIPTPGVCALITAAALALRSRRT